MHILSAEQKTVPLRLLDLDERVGRHGPVFDVAGTEDSARHSQLVTAAARATFEMVGERAIRARRRRAIPPAVFEEEETRLLRIAYKEVVIRFHPKTRKSVQDKILKKYGFRRRVWNRFVRLQYVVYDPRRKYVSADLLEVTNDWATMKEVAFAVPNFVSEFRRESPVPPIHPEQWHLRNRAKFDGQLAGEDVDASGAWATSLGRPSIVVAVLDDGVDVEHPSLRSRVLRNPDPREARDVVGRDFFVPDDSSEHFNPRPKNFKYPYEQMEGNDIHGTPCAGVTAAAGNDSNVYGIAPRCKILPVKIFHADFLAADARVADAIRYAASFADVLSCSWSGPWSPDIELAVQDAAAARAGLGAAIFCAAGNDYRKPVSFPASLAETVAVGASTDQGRLADYSNIGAEISLVAPSSGGVRGIYTTDVSYPNRGFNPGNPDYGDPDGYYTNSFGGTSSATPLAAGIAALVLSVKSNLSRDEVQDLLQSTADKIGGGYSAKGHSPRYGHGRVNAATAVDAALAARPRKRMKKATKARKARGK